MNLKDKLSTLRNILDTNRITSSWENDSCILIKAPNMNGFDIKLEFTQFDVFL